MPNSPSNYTNNTVILLVDDEKSILSSLKRALRPFGYKILIAENAQDGLNILKKEAVDLIISDKKMPEMDGIEFLQQAAKKWPNTIRILLTGLSEAPSYHETINKAQIHHYLTKPWEDSELKLIIEYALENRNIKDNETMLAPPSTLIQKLNHKLFRRLRGLL